MYAKFEAKPQLHRRATSSDMLQAIDDRQDGKDIVILDARGHEQYTGEVSLSVTSDKQNLASFASCHLLA